MKSAARSPAEVHAVQPRECFKEGFVYLFTFSSLKTLNFDNFKVTFVDILIVVVAI